MYGVRQSACWVCSSKNSKDSCAYGPLCCGQQQWVGLMRQRVLDQKPFQQGLWVRWKHWCAIAHTYLRHCASDDAHASTQTHVHSQYITTPTVPCVGFEQRCRPSGLAWVCAVSYIFLLRAWQQTATRCCFGRLQLMLSQHSVHSTSNCTTPRPLLLLLRWRQRLRLAVCAAALHGPGLSSGLQRQGSGV